MRQLFNFSWANLFAPTNDYAFLILGALRSQVMQMFGIVFAIVFIVFFMIGADRVRLISGINVSYAAVSLLLGAFMISIPIALQPVVCVVFFMIADKLRAYQKEKLKLYLEGVTTTEAVDSPKAWIQKDAFKRLSIQQKEEYRKKTKKKYKCRYRLWIALFCGAAAGSILFLIILGRGYFPVYVEVFGGDAYKELISRWYAVK